MKEYKTSEARRKANAKWTHKNKTKQTRYVYKSNAKNFIKKYASVDDLKELELLIQSKLKELNS